MAWNIAGASYDNVSFLLTNEDSNPMAIAFNSDGTKMYMLGWSTDTVYQYSLSTAWNLSTASYDSVSFSVTNEDSTPVAMAFSADGSKMYISGQGQTVYQYTLSTPWDLSTASYASKSFAVTTQCYYPYGIHFKSDGTKMYIMGNYDVVLDDYYGIIYQYSLSTAWDVSTASYDSKSFDISSQGSGRWYNGVKANLTGTKFYVADDDGFIYQYTLSIAWDISSTFYRTSLDTTDQVYPYSVAFNSNGTKLYVQRTTVYQYLLPDDYPLAPILFPARSRKSTDELKQTCVNFEESVSDVCLILNHNVNVIREYLQTTYGGELYSESSNLRDVLPSQQLVKLSNKDLTDEDLKAIINNFITNVSSMFTLINENNRLVKTWLDDYMPDESGHDFTDVKMLPITIGKDLSKTMDELFECIEDNVITLNSNLELLKERF